MPLRRHVILNVLKGLNGEILCSALFFDNRIISAELNNWIIARKTSTKRGLSSVKVR